METTHNDHISLACSMCSTFWMFISPSLFIGAPRGRLAEQSTTVKRFVVLFVHRKTFFRTPPPDPLALFHLPHQTWCRAPSKLQGLAKGWATRKLLCGGGGGGDGMGARRRRGGGFQKWASVPGPLFCVRMDVATKGAGTQILAQKIFFTKKFSPTYV